MLMVIRRDRQPLTLHPGGVSGAEEHGLAGWGLEVLFCEGFDTLVELVEAAEGGVLVEETDDGAKGEGEEAEENVDEVLVRLGKHHAVALLVDQEVQGKLLGSGGGGRCVWRGRNTGAGERGIVFER